LPKIKLENICLEYKSNKNFLGSAVGTNVKCMVTFDKCEGLPDRVAIA
jgi:hypothetical protein